MSSIDFSLFDPTNEDLLNAKNFDEIKVERLSNDVIEQKNTEIKNKLEEYRHFFFDEVGNKKDVELKATKSSDGIPSLRQVLKDLAICQSNKNKEQMIASVYERYGEKTSIKIDVVKPTVVTETNTSQQIQPQIIQPQIKEEDKVLLEKCSESKKARILAVLKKYEFIKPVYSIPDLVNMSQSEIEEHDKDLTTELSQRLQNVGEILHMGILLYGNALEEIGPAFGLSFDGTRDFYMENKEMICATLNELVEDNPAIAKMFTPKMMVVYYIFLAPASRAYINMLQKKT
jgi:hypothetical protein